MMSATKTVPRPSALISIINGILAIKPLAKFAKHKARKMMIERADSIGVPWLERVAELRSQDLETELAAIKNPEINYPSYYLRPFHAYDNGNLGWEAATEVEVAAYAVHSRIWQGAGADGDPKLRRSYHEVLKQQIQAEPQDILDVGCSVGMSTFALQANYPQAKITGLDLSPNFLAIARHKAKTSSGSNAIAWQHAPAEATNLPDASFDLVSLFLICHELPQTATLEIFREMRRLLRPNGYMTIMDMNPKSEIYAKMPPYILTLLKSTEPYLDQYFALDIENAIAQSGFSLPTITSNSPRHRTIVAQAP
jgi:ubiquinone/menaquinone biosynthesis C-methylase UbiE